MTETVSGKDDTGSDTPGQTGATDPMALVLATLREAYQENAESLRDYAEKVKKFNEQKKALRKYLAALRSFKARVLSAAREKGVDLCRGNEEDAEKLRELFEKHVRDCKVGELEYELCIPNRVPPEEVRNLDSLDSEIARWEELLNTVGDDAQLAQVDLQNIVQKVQQSLTMMSNLSKTLHDASMAVIRNMKG